jgi:integrase/recombinase XerD
MPKSDEPTLLLIEYGRPFKSAAAFGNKFADWCDQAGLKPVLCKDGIHGLRKAACVQLAEAGCTAPEIMAVSGHVTLSEAQKYVTDVEQKQMAEAATAKRAAGSKRGQVVTEAKKRHD